MINSTFGGFMTARQGMAAAQHGLNLTGHNLTNSATEGYTRQRIDQVSLNFNGTYRYASQYNVNVGNGVLVTGTSQLRDPFLDLRYRNEVAHVGEQGIKLEVLGDLVVDKAVTAQIDKDEVVKAPGMKYKHYAPQSEVVIVSGSREKAAAYIRAHFVPGDRVLCFEEELPLYEGCDPLSYGREADVNSLSAGLFAALRELDDPKIHQVYARCPVGGGVAYAVQNRLKKAAAFHIVDAEEEEPPLCRGNSPDMAEGI